MGAGDQGGGPVRGLAQRLRPLSAVADRNGLGKGNASLVARAGPYSGLFQYGTRTWKGAWNTYRDEDILDPKAQIFATALAWKNEMQHQWGCYSRAH